MSSKAKPANGTMHSDSELAELTSLGRYKIKRLVGSGGMGAVFKATDDELKRTVALKVLPKDKAQNSILVRRFKAEAQACAHLDHENIVRVYDHGEVDGYLYIAMEYISGIDVHELMGRQGGVSAKRSLDIARQVTLALGHAHEQDIVHRDIKPSNLMIDKEGTIKLADMGLARCVTDSESTSLTQAGSTVGTVDYMSPEQARNSKSADTRSDIYSLGATWYHMLVGHAPFPEGSVINKIHAHCEEPVPDPRDKNPDVPDAIVDIVLKMLEKEPTNRYQTPEELLYDIEHANLSKKEISIGLLASLADEDEVDTGPVLKRTRTKTAERNSEPKPKPPKPKPPTPKPQAKNSRTESKRNESNRSDKRSESRSKKRSEEASRKAQTADRKAAAQSKKSEQAASRKEASQKKKKSQAEHEESSIPSARDALLNRPMLKRGAAKRKKANVSLDTSRLFKIVGGVAAALVLFGFLFVEIRSALTGPDETDKPSPDTSGAPTVNVAPPPDVEDAIPGSRPNSSQPK